MKLVTVRKQCFILFTTLSFAGCSYGLKQVSATEDTWGRTDYQNLDWQSQGNIKNAPAWQNSAGAHASLIEIVAGHSLSKAYEKDTKGVVVSGQLKVADSILTKGAYWARSGGTSDNLTCSSQDKCVVYLETEPTVGSVLPALIAAKDIPWFEVPNTYGNVFLAWVWGEANSAEPSSFFLKFKAGFPGAPHTHSRGYNGLTTCHIVCPAKNRLRKA